MEIPKVGVWYYRNIVRRGTQSYREGDELRYSIRSAVKNLGLEKVILVGDKPSWFKESEQAIWVNSPYILDPVSPIASIPWNHLKRLYQSKKYRGEFLLFNDDFFVLQPLDFWSDTYRDPVEYRFKVEKNREYHMREQRALLTLGSSNGKHFNLHIPMRVHTDNLPNIFSVRERSLRQDLPFRTLYGNLFLPNAVPYRDVKGESDGVFYSSSEQTWKDQEWLRELFPEPSFCESN